MNRKLIFFGVFMFLIQTRQLVELDEDNSTAIIDESMLDSKKLTASNHDIISSSDINSFMYYSKFRFLVAVSSEIFVYNKSYETSIKYRFESSFNAHNSSIYAIYRLSNGGFATGSADRTIKLWTDPRVDALRLTINNAHTSSINCLLEITYDIPYILVSGSGDGTIKIWNSQTGALIRTLVGHAGAVTSLLDTSINRTLFSSSADSTIRIWNYKTGALLRILTGHTDSVRAMLFFNFNQDTLISASSDKTIRFWNSDTGALIETKNDLHSASINALIYCDSYLLSASSDGTIKVWEPKPEYNFSTYLISNVWLILQKTISDKNNVKVLNLQRLSYSYPIFMALYDQKVLAWKLSKSNSHSLIWLYLVISIVVFVILIVICVKCCKSDGPLYVVEKRVYTETTVRRIR